MLYFKTYMLYIPVNLKKCIFVYPRLRELVKQTTFFPQFHLWSISWNASGLLMHGRRRVTTAIFLSDSKWLKIRGIRVKELSLEFNKLHSGLYHDWFCAQGFFINPLEHRLQHGSCPDTGINIPSQGQRHWEGQRGGRGPRKHLLLCYNHFHTTTLQYIQHIQYLLLCNRGADCSNIYCFDPTEKGCKDCYLCVTL